MQLINHNLMVVHTYLKLLNMLIVKKSMIELLYLLMSNLMMVFQLLLVEDIVSMCLLIRMELLMEITG